MKTLLILGSGTGGTMVANKMTNHLDPQQWRIVVVDRDETHLYQPGLLFIPFGLYKAEQIVRPRRKLLPRNVEVIFSGVERIEPDNNRVILSGSSEPLSYDYLVIATGSHIHPEETP